jgi:hypothetical protein
MFPDLRRLFLDVLDQCARAAAQDRWLEAEIWWTHQLIRDAVARTRPGIFSNEEYTKALSAPARVRTGAPGVRGRPSRESAMRRYLVALTIGTPPAARDYVTLCARHRRRPPCSSGAADIAVCGAGGRWKPAACSTHSRARSFVAGDIAYTRGNGPSSFAPVTTGAGGGTRRDASGPPATTSTARPARRPTLLLRVERWSKRLGYYRYHKGCGSSFSSTAISRGRAHGAARMVEAASLRPVGLQRSRTFTILFSSGPHGTVPRCPLSLISGASFMRRARTRDHGHEHFYERFAPQNPDGASDPRFGLRQFIVGTGGAPMTQPVGERRTARRRPDVLVCFGRRRSPVVPMGLSVCGCGAIRDSGSGTVTGSRRPPTKQGTRRLGKEL